MASLTDSKENASRRNNDKKKEKVIESIIRIPEEELRKKKLLDDPKNGKLPTIKEIVEMKLKEERKKNQKKEEKTHSGDPINVVTGAFEATSVDLVIESRGMSVELIREYNSQNDIVSQFGRGWTFNFGMKIIKKDEDEVVVVFLMDTITFLDMKNIILLIRHH